MKTKAGKDARVVTIDTVVSDPGEARQVLRLKMKELEGEGDERMVEVEALLDSLDSGTRKIRVEIADGMEWEMDSMDQGNKLIIKKLEEKEKEYEIELELLEKELKTMDLEESEGEKEVRVRVIHDEDGNKTVVRKIVILDEGGDGLKGEKVSGKKTREKKLIRKDNREDRD
ncbi:MAG TPA: hypothetical protein P5550_07755 [Bacteroidales bacterium]|nr:hypothetical protein [Bacteroidales bacterium]HRZ75900.1 hypothetical protein [Bacteroidales bacterium]